MKKKLLAVVLSVVMIAALIVPMMMASAAAPTLAIGLGTPTLTDRNDVKVIAVPVILTGNTGEMYAIRYQVVSTSGLEPYFDEELYDEGYDEGDITQKYGGKTAKFANTINYDCVVDGNKGFQCVQDVVDGPTGKGITNTSGTFLTVYFVAPTAVGSYDFELIWMDGADNNKVQFEVTVADPVTYTVECTSHVEGEAVVTKEATCEEDGEKVISCTACGKELKKEAIAKLGHDWDAGVAAEGVACGETADVTKTCGRCGKTKVETGAKVEHDWVEDEAAYVAPKCEVAGKKVYKCSNPNCPVKTKDEAVAALEHKWDAGAPEEGKVCGETADVIHNCENGCGKTKTDKGAVIEHDWKLDDSKHVDPKCEVAGKDVYVCQRANCPVGEREEAIDALEHVYTEYAVVLLPTADAEGKKEAACDNGCGKKDEKSIAKLATSVKNDNLTFTADSAILPEDINGVVIDTKEENGKITQVVTFGSDIIDDLTGKVTVAVDTEGTTKNFAITTKDAAGNDVAVEFTFENGVVTFEAELGEEYVLSFEEVKQSPDTADTANVVVFAIAALIAVAGLVVVGKKRFAL